MRRVSSVDEAVAETKSRLMLVFVLNGGLECLSSGKQQIFAVEYLVFFLKEPVGGLLLF
ncbi:MAG TPA: hypothetical protein DEB17_03320 [Chlorobaculum sp.]|uniref:Uncharacterized protein n=1 Tax=Chlorobaculum tepidum (strain ATCC 49652 / DSM 12025 / NBRC 103806 / TLS) TaxID=194439 RepID=Q8KDM4_CHLTE|nr:hypothetical protein CT1022 [Chlorobaculum tepidum TLS]HBU23016.1 hypothetical protein [Chlorobaculum sp.]